MGIGFHANNAGENMHTRAKSHLSKFYSKTKKIRESSAFIKHKYGGFKEGDVFEDYFEIFNEKAYKKPITRIIEEGVFIINYEGEILNSKTEWHQPKIIRTTILQGGAEMAGGMMVNSQQAGRHPVTPVVNVDIDQVQQGHQVATSRTTRAMSRIAGGH